MLSVYESTVEFPAHPFVQTQKVRYFTHTPKKPGSTFSTAYCHYVGEVVERVGRRDAEGGE